tara:strand:+ start:51 stop:980 length:930 start_codon:yes stop_codon:yes gene_type:complete
MKALLKEKGQVKIAQIGAPTGVARDEVLIKVALTGICRTDIYVAQNIIQTDDLVLGHEFSGTIEAVGEDVDNFDLGERVCVFPFIYDNYTQKENFLASKMLGLHTNGSFADYIAVPKECVYKLPDNVSFKMGAYMEPVCASMAVLKADINTKQKGMIIGENRIAQLTLRVLQAKGFENVTLFDPEVNDGVEILDNSFDFIIETLATTEMMNLMVRAIKPKGTIILKSRQHKPVEIKVNDLVQKDITLKAVSYADFQDAIDLAASGALKVDDLLGETYPLEEYETVFELSQKGEAKKLFLTTATDMNVIN